MSKFSEYLKLIPKGLSNPSKILEGWWNEYNFENLKEDEIAEIIRRRAICEECPLNSIKAKTSKEYKDLYGENYTTDREELHCSICGCPAQAKTASLSTDCGLTEYNNKNPNNKQTLKWIKYDNNKTE